MQPKSEKVRKILFLCGGGNHKQKQTLLLKVAPCHPAILDEICFT